MFGRENIIGILLLCLCGVAAFILIIAIVNGEMPRVPENAAAPITLAGIVLMGILFWRQISRWFRRK